jgi:hypothetical protein
VGDLLQHAACAPVPERPDVAEPIPLHRRSGSVSAETYGANGEQWVSRLVARNGVVCVDSQHISVGKHFGGSTCDVLVTPGLFQFWVGNELLKTVARAKPGEVRKKHAEGTANRR